MARGSMRDFMTANRLEGIAARYDFPLVSCDCGHGNIEIEDILIKAAGLLKRGEVDLKWSEGK